VGSERSVEVGRRWVPLATQRQALALLGIGAVTVSTFLLLNLPRHDLGVVLFEVVSAFATVGLSVGITQVYRQRVICSSSC
jgi:trk system potassium uptake protein TrkH